MRGAQPPVDGGSHGCDPTASVCCRNACATPSQRVANMKVMSWCPTEKTQRQTHNWQLLGREVLSRVEHYLGCLHTFTMTPNYFLLYLARHVVSIRTPKGAIPGGGLDEVPPADATAKSPTMSARHVCLCHVALGE